MSVLVDSSVWIDAAKPTSKNKRRLSELIHSEEIICYSNPIQAEVCQGARTQREFEKLWDAFLGFHPLEVKKSHWEQTAWNYFRCRKKGISVSTIDCLIATTAQSYRVPLWTLDKVFTKMQPVLGFDLKAFE